MMYYGGMNAGWVFFGTVAIVAIIAAVVWAIMRTTSQRGPNDAPDTSRDNALTRLQRRYASGDIDEQEYVRRRNLLAQH